MGTIDLRGDGVNTEMETGSRSTAAPIVAHRASWSEKFRGTPLTEANQAIQAYAWTVGQLRYAQLPHSPTTQPQPDISFATESGHLHLLLTLPTETVVITLVEGLKFCCHKIRILRDRLQVRFAMIPCPGSNSSPGTYSQNQNPSAKAVRVTRPIATVVRGCVNEDNTEPGISAGTQWLLVALFPAPHPSRPSPRVRPHQRSLDRGFGQLVLPRSGG